MHTNTLARVSRGSIRALALVSALLLPSTSFAQSPATATTPATSPNPTLSTSTLSAAAATTSSAFAIADDTNDADADQARGQARRLPPTRPVPPPPERAVTFMGFALFGTTSFAAQDSFEAILDSSSGAIYGGGGQINLPLNLFARVDVSRFGKDGTRVFVDNGEVFDLGIPTRVTITPIEVTGGYRYRFGRRTASGPRSPRTPARGSRRGGLNIAIYGGGGIGSVQFKETSDFALPGEDVDESFTSYHVLGGVDVPIWKWLGAGAEFQYRWVPDALDGSLSGVSELFDETDLNSSSFRVRIFVLF